MDNYKKGDTIYILMDSDKARTLMEDWLETGYECDLLVHRSKKNKGKLVVETQDLMWAMRIIKWIGYEQVSYGRKTTNTER